MPCRKRSAVRVALAPRDAKGLKGFCVEGSMYVDQSIDGLSMIWHDAMVQSAERTHRGTYLEMIQHPHWGLTCYMDGDIQSSEFDEAIYHETLVHPAMASVPAPKRVMIMGGGEGATAREVLKWPTVECVDMYEWDMDVMALFRRSYPQWAKGAWEDPRLHLHPVDVLEAIQTPPLQPYDVIIVDLFEPSESMRAEWERLLTWLPKWTHSGSSVALYAGDPRARATAGCMIAEILQRNTETMQYRRVVPYRTFLPCFMGEAEFVLWCGKWETLRPTAHMTEERWERLRGDARKGGAPRS